MGSRVGHEVLRDTRRSRSVGAPRSNDRVITEKLESVWPDVAERLAAMLRRRGVNRHEADEAIQETAAHGMAVARHRARNRLRSLLDGLAAPVLGLWARRGRWRSARVEAFASSVTPAFACLALTVTSLGVMPPVSGSTQSNLTAHAAVAVS